MIDAANAFVLLLLSGSAAWYSTVVLPDAKASVGQEIAATTRIRLFYALLPAVPDRAAWVWSPTGDAFNVFVFLEISSLSTYVLIAQGRVASDKRALSAAYDYLIMGTIGATFFVIGIGFLYMATGTLNMADLAERIADRTGAITGRCRRRLPSSYRRHRA